MRSIAKTMANSNHFNTSPACKKLIEEHGPSNAPKKTTKAPYYW